MKHEYIHREIYIFSLYIVFSAFLKFHPKGVNLGESSASDSVVFTRGGLQRLILRFHIPGQPVHSNRPAGLVGGHDFDFTLLTECVHEHGKALGIGLHTFE